MTTGVKQMLEAANAVVPKITPDQASDMIKKGDTLVVDVRDQLEVALSGMIAGAVNVSRGMLEFRADPESPYHDKNFEKRKTNNPVLRLWRAISPRWQAAQRYGLRQCLQSRWLQRLDWSG